MVRLRPFLVVGMLLLPSFALADAAALTVTRDANATSCPSESDLSRRFYDVLHASGKELTDTRASVHVAQGPRGHVITLALSGARAGTRVLADQTASCESMVDAATTVLALMLEPVGAKKRKPEPVPSPEVAPQPLPSSEESTPEDNDVPEEPVKEEPELAAEPPSSLREADQPPDEVAAMSRQKTPSANLSFDLGGGVTRGLLDRPVATFSLGGFWTKWKPWSLGLGVFYQPYSHVTATGVGAYGDVSLALTGTNLQACVTAVGRREATSLEVCLDARAALASAESSGYSYSRSATRLMATLGAAPLFRQAITDRFGLWARASVDAPIVEASYSIESVGTVYDSGKIFFVASAGLSVTP